MTNKKRINKLARILRKEHGFEFCEAFSVHYPSSEKKQERSDYYAVLH